MNRSAVGSDRKPHFRSDGIHHATINNHRFHLRLNKGDQHHLWIDGRQPPLILDQTAADFVAYIIEGMWLYQRGNGDNSQQVIDHVLMAMQKKYDRRIRKIAPDRIRTDLDRIFGILMQMADGGCPVEINLQGKDINYAKWTAPARMDLAVTYRCNLRCGKCYLPGSHEGEELSYDEWLRVYEILWSIGVPLVVFTGGEPTMRDDIVKLISAADEFVTGLVTNGTRLVEFAKPLRDASLDYVQVTIESYDPETHDQMTEVPGSHAQAIAGIREAVKEDLQVVTNTTITKANGPDFVKTMKWLHEELCVNSIACNTLICSGKGTAYRNEYGLGDTEIKQILAEAHSLAIEKGIDFQWYSPTCYNAGINPMELGLGIKSCSAAAHNMTIQPDGTVLPCQSWPDTVGNILTDSWKKIWRHPVCLKLRNQQMAASECKRCKHIETCAGGCPLDTAPRICTTEAKI